MTLMNPLCGLLSLALLQPAEATEASTPEAASTLEAEVSATETGTAEADETPVRADELTEPDADETEEPNTEKSPPPPQSYTPEATPPAPTNADGLRACSRPRMARAGMGTAVAGITAGLLLSLPAILQSRPPRDQRDSDANLVDEEEDDNVIDHQHDWSRASQTSVNLAYAGLAVAGASLLVGVPLTLAACRERQGPEKVVRRAGPRRVGVAVNAGRQSGGAQLHVRF